MESLENLARMVGGEVSGPRDLVLKGAAPFEEAGEGEITLAGSPAYLSKLDATAASAVIVPPGTSHAAKPLLLTRNPKLAFARILGHFNKKAFIPSGISERAAIGTDCRIAEEVSIHPFVAVGDRVVIEREVTLYSGVSVGDDCTIGAGSTLFPNVVLYPGTRLGERVFIHGGSVIGADGFGYVFDGRAQVKMPQTGHVEIADDVEIGANCTIDRATFGATVVERHVKIDNLVHVAHNCRIGENTVIVGCCGISGSVSIGRNCVLAGQVGIADHIRIGEGVTILARAAVFKDVPDGATVSGTPARDHRLELKAQAAIRRLPDLLARLRSREKPEEDP